MNNQSSTHRILAGLAFLATLAAALAGGGGVEVAAYAPGEPPIEQAARPLHRRCCAPVRMSEEGAP